MRPRRQQTGGAPRINLSDISDSASSTAYDPPEVLYACRSRPCQRVSLPSCMPFSTCMAHCPLPTYTHDARQHVRVASARGDNYGNCRRCNHEEAMYAPTLHARLSASRNHHDVVVGASE
jgi:hypothetical protein